MYDDQLYKAYGYIPINEASIDSKLRELQRHWKQTGSNEDYVAFLQAWLRSGTSAKRWGIDPVSLYELDFRSASNYVNKHYKGEVWALRGNYTRSLVSHIDFVDTFPLTGDTKMLSLRIYYPNEAYLRDLVRRYTTETQSERADTVVYMRGRVVPLMPGAARLTPAWRDYYNKINKLYMSLFSHREIPRRR